jgi:hypothetical protein
MEDFKIKQTEDTPEVSFTASSAKYLIKGKSFPENPSEYYFPIYKQLEEFISSADKLTLESDLEYINSSSVKMIFAIFNLLNNQHNKNPKGEFKIIWKFKSNDTIMENKGKEFKEFLDLPFELVLQS